jgi:hypothetical protein
MSSIAAEQVLIRAYFLVSAFVGVMAMRIREMFSNRVSLM